MPREIHLNGAVADDDRDIVQLFDKTYRLQPVTRSVQKKLHVVSTALDAIPEDAGEDGYDQVVELLADGIDVLLEIDGTHRTSAKKLLMQKWESDDLTLQQIQNYYTELQTSEAEARPT